MDAGPAASLKVAAEKRKKKGLLNLQVAAGPICARPLSHINLKISLDSPCPGCCLLRVLWTCIMLLQGAHDRGAELGDERDGVLFSPSSQIVFYFYFLSCFQHRP